jgi:hypothetical protein
VLDELEEMEDKRRQLPLRNGVIVFSIPMVILGRLVS